MLSARNPLSLLFQRQKRDVHLQIWS